MALSTRTIVLSGLGVALLGSLAYVSFREEPVPVDLAEVMRGPMEVTISADGKTRVRDLFEVTSPIAGTAMRSPVEVGDPVTEGETVVAIVRPTISGLLDDRSRLQAEAALQETEAARGVAEADRLQAQENLAFVQSQYDRIEELVKRGVASVTQLEDATQRLKVANATLTAAEARLDMADGAVERARASLFMPRETDAAPDACCVELHAPTDGVILSVATVSERPVTVGSPLVTIGDPDDLELVADVLSTDAVRLSGGAAAYVERWGGTTVLDARLDRIDPKAYTKVSALGIEEQRVDAYFSLVSPPESRPGLKDGFSVFLRIVEWRADDVLQIPLSAIFRHGEGWAVFVATNGKVELRPIEIGRRNGQMTEVLDNLEAGERVVTHPSDALEAGKSIIERTSLRG